MTKALDLLKNLHYHICNGGWKQACFNGFVDRLWDEFSKNGPFVKSGTNTEFSTALKDEIGEDTPEAKEALKAARLIEDALSQTEMQESCGSCGGCGETDEGEVCDECRGNGCDEVYLYRDVSFDDYTNTWEEEWDSQYFSSVNSDLVDKATGQSGTHSVLLDAIQGGKAQASAVRSFKYKGELVQAATKAEAIRKLVGASSSSRDDEYAKVLEKLGFLGWDSSEGYFNGGGRQSLSLDFVRGRSEYPVDERDRDCGRFSVCVSAHDTRLTDYADFKPKDAGELERWLRKALDEYYKVVRTVNNFKVKV